MRTCVGNSKSWRGWHCASSDFKQVAGSFISTADVGGRWIIVHDQNLVPSSSSYPLTLSLSRMTWHLYRVWLCKTPISMRISGITVTKDQQRSSWTQVRENKRSCQDSLRSHLLESEHVGSRGVDWIWGRFRSQGRGGGHRSPCIARLDTRERVIGYTRRAG